MLKSDEYIIFDTAKGFIDEWKYAGGESCRLDERIEPELSAQQEQHLEAQNAIRDNAALIELADQQLDPISLLPGLSISIELKEIRRKAACKGSKDHFPRGHNEREKDREFREKKAIAICRNCPVLEQCLEYAVTQGEGGIWGGTTDEQRMISGYEVRYADNAVKNRVKKMREKLGDQKEQKAS